MCRILYIVDTNKIKALMSQESFIYWAGVAVVAAALGPFPNLRISMSYKISSIFFMSYLIVSNLLRKKSEGVE